MPSPATQRPPRASLWRRGLLPVVMVLVSAALAAACDGPLYTLGTPLPDCDPPGTVIATTITTGTSIDPNGYTVTFDDDGRAFDIGVNESVDLGEVDDDSHTLTLSGVAANCILFDRTGQPTARCAQGAEVTFLVDCTTALPGLTGVLAFTTMTAGDIEIASLRADGTNLRNLTISPGEDVEPDWAPARASLAFTSLRDGQREIYVMGPDGSGQTRLTNDPADDWQPDWSPDGTRIAFTSFRDDRAQVYVMDADGSSQANRSDNDHNDSQPAWSPDGSRLAFVSDRAGGQEVFTMAEDGSDVVQVTGLAGASFSEQPAWSPDGTRLLILRGLNVFVIDIGTGDEVQLTDGGTSHDPAWSPDGEYIAFRSDRLIVSEIFVMRADGSGVFNRTLTPFFDAEPDWK